MSRKLVAAMVAALVILSILPTVFAVGVGSGIGVVIGAGEEAPEVWIDPASRVTIEDPAANVGTIVTRQNNYAFEGEQIRWEVAVKDQNGWEDVSEVYVTVGTTGQQAGDNDREVQCIRTRRGTD